MGLSHPSIEHMIKFANTSGMPKTSVMLGRQQLNFRPTYTERVQSAFAEQGITGIDLPNDIRNPDRYSEKFFEVLGYPDIKTMDNSAYEGATLIHDLNTSIPDDLKNQFDFIFDGGTLEHVFNIPTAFDNVFQMLRPGGLFVSINALNGWVGHGFYQFGPDLVYSYWQRSMGCTVKKCFAYTAAPHEVREIPLIDAALVGRRIEYDENQIPPGRVFLLYAIEKPMETAEKTEVQQADYDAAWKSHADT